MRWKDVNLKPDVRLLRQFGGISALACAGITIWQGAVMNRPIPGILAGVAAVIFALLALMRPNWLRVVYVGSIVATFPIGWVVSNVVMLLLYFGMITPLALVFRWSGRDLLNLKPPSGNETTFWSPKNLELDKRNYFRQF